MYSSLDRIDLVAKAPELVYVLTDHRSADEMDAEPEATVLFALTRILGGQRMAEAEGVTAAVVYAPMADEVPAYLRDALAATGTLIERVGGGARTVLAPIAATAAELADAAFAGLAKRVAGRTGLSDPAAALRVVEAESLAERPDREADEAGYWTRVLELTALVGEVLRAQYGGRWTESRNGVIPFGFQTKKGGIALPANRAQRFLADGEGESMLHLLAGLREAEELRGEDLPLLPSLRSRADAEQSKLVTKPLIGNAPADADVPVIAYGHDAPQTFGLLFELKDQTLDDVHARALANIAAIEVEVKPFELKDVQLLAVTGSFFATEKLLDPAFMRTLHAKLGSELLVATVPRRGLMFVTAIGGPMSLNVLAAVTEHEAQTTRSISQTPIIVQDGEVSGYVQARKADDASPEDPEPAPSAPKKKSFWKRLFGR